MVVSISITVYRFTLVSLYSRVLARSLNRIPGRPTDSESRLGATQRTQIDLGVEGSGVVVGRCIPKHPNNTNTQKNRLSIGVGPLFI